MTMVEVKTIEELKSITRGTLVKIVGQHSNGVKLVEEGRVHEPLNNCMITLINCDGETISDTWIRFNPKSNNIVCVDYVGNDFYSDMPQHQELLEAWEGYQK